MKEHAVPSWFFVGALLSVYCVLIRSLGIVGLSRPPHVALAHLPERVG